MKRVLIDSDVLMDFLTERGPHYHASVEIISCCELKKIHGFITPVIISNLYYLLSRIIKRESVIEKLKKLMVILDVLVIDKEIIVKSLHSNFNDFEDALQNYAAEYSKKVPYIITRNIKDYRHSGLNVMTPSDFLKILY